MLEVTINTRENKVHLVLEGEKVTVKTDTSYTNTNHRVPLPTFNPLPGDQASRERRFSERVKASIKIVCTDFGFNECYHTKFETLTAILAEDTRLKNHVYSQGDAYLVRLASALGIPSEESLKSEFAEFINIRLNGYGYDSK